jgi:hypothetical protein
MQEWCQRREQQRAARIAEIIDGSVVDDPQNWLKSAKTLVGLTSSRLGHRPEVHRQVCRFLGRSALDCRSRGGVLLVAVGSAIEPWAIRAAELFDVTLVCVVVGPPQSRQAVARNVHPTIRIHHQDPSLSRDEVIVGIADRIDAVHVRRGGRISAALHSRLQRCSDASIRVAVAPKNLSGAASKDGQSDAIALIQAGAVGWYDLSLNEIEIAQQTRNKTRFKVDASWAHQAGQWLVHCTRAPTGPWPDETIDQYRDAMILGDDSVLNREPVDSLLQILRSGRLLASAVATSKQCPVVCFSELSLCEVLSKRCFRPHLGRWDYEPFGIAIRLPSAQRLGCQPVVYGQPGEQQKLKTAERFRFHPVGKTYDWREEREWRCPRTINLAEIPNDDLHVFSLKSDISERKLTDCGVSVTWIEFENAGNDLHETCQEK